MNNELSSFAPALFEARNVFQKVATHQLAHAINDHARDAILNCVSETEYNIIDGSSLLNQIPWKHG